MKLYKLASFVVILIVATIFGFIEMVVKMISFAIAATLCFILMLFAPLVANRTPLKFMSSFMDYAFSFKFIFAKAMVNKYIDALGL